MDVICDVNSGDPGMGGRQSGKYRRSTEIGSTSLDRRMSVDLWRQV